MTNIAGMVEDERIVVAYLGPEGSYTHQATLSAFPDNNSVNISPQTTISDVFAAVQSGTAARGVVPFENSSNGSVVFTLDLFADLQGKYPDILVCDEAYVQVQHCLLGHAVAPAPAPAEGNTTANTTTTNTNNNQNNPSPHPSFTHIKRLYSHPQAWGQCTNFLTTYLPHTTRHDVASTSLAAQLVAQDTSHTSAALSSISAASLFHLDVLAHTVNDRVGNTTRFLVIRKGRRGVGVGGPESPRQIAQQQEQEEEEKEEETKRFKSLVTFIPDDDAHPGALARCLAVFSTRGINLTSINTRPAGGENWRYIFFVEFQGRLMEGGQGEGGEDGHAEGHGEGEGEALVQEALGELGSVSRTCRWLGSWVDRTPVKV